MDISCFSTQAKLMALQCRMAHVTQVLEVGTLGGYTAILIASMNPEARIVSIEVDPAIAKVARDNIETAGYADRIKVFVGAALDVLPQIEAKVRKEK
jgi:predicted O-methyltransferase YrrM